MSSDDKSSYNLPNWNSHATVLGSQSVGEHNTNVFHHNHNTITSNNDNNSSTNPITNNGKYAITVSGAVFGQGIGDGQTNTFNHQNTINNNNTDKKSQFKSSSTTITEHNLNDHSGFTAIQLGDNAHNTYNNHIHIHINDTKQTEVITKALESFTQIKSNPKKRSLSSTNIDNQPVMKKRKLTQSNEKACDTNGKIEHKKGDNINDIDGVTNNNESSIITNKETLTNVASEKPKKSKPTKIQYDLVKIEKVFDTMYKYDETTKIKLQDKVDANKKSVEFVRGDEKPFEIDDVTSYVDIKPMEKNEDYIKLISPQKVNKKLISRHWYRYVGLRQNGKKRKSGKHAQYLKTIMDSNNNVKEYKCLRKNCKHKKLTKKKQWKNHTQRHK
eukprot:530828_1